MRVSSTPTVTRYDPGSTYDLGVLVLPSVPEGRYVSEKDGDSNRVHLKSV